MDTQTDRVKTQGEDGHLQEKKRGLERILLSRLPGETSPGDTFISDF